MHCCCVVYAYSLCCCGRFTTQRSSMRRALLMRSMLSFRAPPSSRRSIHIIRPLIAYVLHICLKINRHLSIPNAIIIDIHKHGYGAVAGCCCWSFIKSTIIYQTPSASRTRHSKLILFSLIFCMLSKSICTSGMSDFNVGFCIDICVFQNIFIAVCDFDFE